MSTAHAELKFAEQKLRREMREELELQLQLEQQRCSDKIAFMRSQVDAHTEQIRKASYAKAHNEIIKERVQQRARFDMSVDAAVISTKSQHADELHQLNEMQRGYIVRIQELQVENKSLHARNRHLTDTKDAEVRKLELELEHERQRDALLIAGLEEQIRTLQEQLENQGIQSTTASKTERVASSHRTFISLPVLPETLEDRMSELKQSSALGQTLLRQPPMEMKQQSSAHSQQLARIVGETPMDDILGARSGEDMAPALTFDAGFQRGDAPQEAASALTLDQLLGGSLQQ